MYRMMFIVFLLIGCGFQPLTWQEEIDQALVQLRNLTTKESLTMWLDPQNAEILHQE